MANADSEEETTPLIFPPGEYHFTVEFDRALQRHDFACAACDTDLERDGERVYRTIWDNDFSARSMVPLCPDCADTDDWREEIRERRVSNAGRARGWLIETLWPYSTGTIRFTAQVLVELVLAVLVGIGLIVTGWATPVVDVVTAMPLAGAAAAALGYLGHHAIWVRRDPRGYTVRDRKPWQTLALVTLLGIGGLASSIFVTTPAATTLAVVGTALALLAAAHEIGLAVRGDRSDVIVEPDRTLVVGGMRGLTILALAGLLLYPGTWVSVGLAVLPLYACAAYIGYRAPHDTQLRKQIRTIRDEIDDLLNGGTY